MKNEFDTINSLKPKACIFVAKNYGVEEELSSKFELLTAGDYIMKSIDEGYTIFTI